VNASSDVRDLICEILKSKTYVLLRRIFGHICEGESLEAALHHRTLKLSFPAATRKRSGYTIHVAKPQMGEEIKVVQF
jgi:hypothetical protein